MSQRFVLSLDTEKAQALFDHARKTLTREQFLLMLRREIPRMGTELKTVIKDEVAVDYTAKKGEVGAALQGPFSIGGGGVGIRIPMSEPRILIKKGADKRKKEYKAFLKERTGRAGNRKRFMLTPAIGAKAGMVRGGEENLPTSGRRPHYFNSSGRVVVYVKGEHYTRMEKFTATAKGGESKKAYRSTKPKTRPAVGIGIPQMPLTRSKDRIQKEMEARLEKRVVHQVNHILKQAGFK